MPSPGVFTGGQGRSSAPYARADSRPDPTLDRRFEAIVLAWDAAITSADAARLRQMLETACSWGLHLAIAGAKRIGDVDDRLGARPSGPGTLHVRLDHERDVYAVGPEGPALLEPSPFGMTEEGGAVGWEPAELWRLGVGPGQVRALAGDDPDELLRVLEDQVQRRRRGDPPRVDEDAAWALCVDGAGTALERAHESRLTLADGLIGTRGSVVAESVGGEPGVFVAGVYQGHGPPSELLRAPQWNRMAWRLPAGAPVRRVLDLHTGLLWQALGSGADRTEVASFSSLARPGTAALRAASAKAAVEWGPPLTGPTVPLPPQGSRAAGACASLRGEQGGVAVAAAQRQTDEPHGSRLERIAAYRSDPRRRPSAAVAVAALEQAEAAGYERLLNEHRAAMAQRWEEAAVEIAGDPELDRALRFCLFHLLGSAASRGESAVGARGLTGRAYRGHVFWDADVFVLPFFAATHPAAARAMLEYRRRRLRAARAEARGEGRDGAHLPWESAATGEEVTPTSGRDRLGRWTAVRTGELEEHIVSDVAWAADCYAGWTGDRAFLLGPGRGLILDTARWWARRIALDPDGSAHIRSVMGPDEYHSPVDDNAFTNVMARWHLRRAAALGEAVPHAATAEERARWRALADALVDGYDPRTRIYEQFAGFHRLEPLLIASVAPRRPIAATLLLGTERVTGAQVVKQADVLMLHHLVPAEVAPGSLAPNLDHYEPRTAHGSSLSMGVHAALLARAGRVEEARDLLAQTATIDLDDLTDTTAGGLHLAAMGSAWQALAFGFAGLRPSGTLLGIAPHLPSAWDSLTVRLQFRGVRLRVRICHESVSIDADRAARVQIAGSAPVSLASGRTTLPLPARRSAP